MTKTETPYTKLIVPLVLGYLLLAFPHFGYLNILAQNDAIRLGLSKPQLVYSLSLASSGIEIAFVLGLLNYIFQQRKKKDPKRVPIILGCLFLMSAGHALITIAVLRLNANRVDDVAKSTTCRVLVRFEQTNEIAYAECSDFEVARMTVTPEKFASFSNGDYVHIQTKTGRWFDYVVSQEKTAH